MNGRTKVGDAPIFVNAFALESISEQRKAFFFGGMAWLMWHVVEAISSICLGIDALLANLLVLDLEENELTHTSAVELTNVIVKDLHCILLMFLDTGLGELCFLGESGKVLKAMDISRKKINRTLGLSYVSLGFVLFCLRGDGVHLSSE